MLVLLTSLIGNYEHSLPSSRMELHARNIMYTVLMDQRHSDESKVWFTELVDQCPYLMEFAIRDFVSHCFQVDPMFAKHASVLFNVNGFHQIVHQAMDMTRLRVQLHLNFNTNMRDMCMDLTSALKPFHYMLLNISYRLPMPQRDIFAALTSLRSVVPVAAGKSTNITTTAMAPTRQDSDAAFQHAQRVLGTYSLTSSLGIDNPQEIGLAVAAAMEEEPGQEVELLCMAHDIIGAEKFKTLNQWVHIIAQSRRDAFPQVIGLLPLLGASIQETRCILRLIEELRTGALSKQALKAFRIVQQRHPLTYDLMQITVDLIKYHSRVSVIGRLPAHITQAQFHTCTQQFAETANTDLAIYDSFDYLFCCVCHTVYSMVRDFKCNSKRVYRYGYRDVVVDHDTDFLYCDKNRSNHMGRCMDIPLVRLPLFGVMIKHDQKCILLCPRCTSPMVLNVDLCAYTRDGYVCQKCTYEIGTPQVKELRRLNSIAKNKLRRCVLCNKERLSPVSSHYYAPGVYLCTHHQSRYIQTKVKNAEYHKGRRLNCAEATELLVTLKQQRVKLIQQRNKGRWRKQIAMAKLSRLSRR